MRSSPRVNLQTAASMLNLFNQLHKTWADFGEQSKFNQVAVGDL